MLFLPGSVNEFYLLHKVCLWERKRSNPFSIFLKPDAALLCS